MTEPTYPGPNTIVLKGELTEKYEEYHVGTGPITPGMLVERDATATYKEDSTFTTMKKHATANGIAVPRIAVESVFTARPDAGTGYGGTIDDDYVTGDLLRCHLCQPGDIIFGFLKTGNNAVPGAKLASAGDGTFQVSTTNPLFEAVDVLNNTSGAKARCRMRCL